MKERIKAFGQFVTNWFNRIRSSNKKEKINVYTTNKSFDDIVTFFRTKYLRENCSPRQDKHFLCLDETIICCKDGIGSFFVDEIKKGNHEYDFSLGNVKNILVNYSENESRKVDQKFKVAVKTICKLTNKKRTRLKPIEEEKLKEILNSMMDNFEKQLNVYNYRNRGFAQEIINSDPRDIFPSLKKPTNSLTLKESNI